MKRVRDVRLAHRVLVDRVVEVRDVVVEELVGLEVLVGRLGEVVAQRGRRRQRREARLVVLVVMRFVKNQHEPLVRRRRPAARRSIHATSATTAATIMATHALLAFLLHFLVEIVVRSRVVILAADVALARHGTAAARRARGAVVVSAAAVARHRRRRRVCTFASSTTSAATASPTVIGEQSSTAVGLGRTGRFHRGVSRTNLTEVLAQFGPRADVTARDTSELVHVRDLGRALDDVEHLFVQVRVADLIVRVESQKLTIGALRERDERHDLVDITALPDLLQELTTDVARRCLGVAANVRLERDVRELEVGVMRGHDAVELRDGARRIIEVAPRFLTVGGELILALDAERLHPLVGRVVISGVVRGDAGRVLVGHHFRLERGPREHVIAAEERAHVQPPLAKGGIIELRVERRRFLAGGRHGCGRTRGCRRSGRCRTRGPCSATTGRAAVRVCPAVATGSLLFELESDHWSICRPYTTRESDSCSSGCPLVSESGGGEAYWAWLVLCACRVSTCGGSSSALAAPGSTSSSGRCTVPMLAHWCP